MFHIYLSAAFYAHLDMGVLGLVWIRWYNWKPDRAHPLLDFQLKSLPVNKKFTQLSRTCLPIKIFWKSCHFQIILFRLLDSLGNSPSSGVVVDRWRGGEQWWWRGWHHLETWNWVESLNSQGCVAPNLSEQTLNPAGYHTLGKSHDGNLLEGCDQNSS